MPISPFNFRTFLLISTSLLCVACDQSTPDAQTEQPTSDDVTGIYVPYRIDTPPPTVSGNYLAGQFAQSKSDWESSADYFSSVLSFSPDNLELQRRVMALQMGAGHYDIALSIARELAKNQSSGNALAHILVSLNAFKEGHYSDALKNIDMYKNDAVGVAITPLLKSWIDAQSGKANTDGLSSTSASLLYQAILISAATNDAVTLKKLAMAHDYTKIPTSIERLEHIATIFQHFGENQTARTILNALKNEMTERAEKYESALKDIETNAHPPLPKDLTNPQSAVSEALFDMAQLLAGSYPDSGRLFAHMALFLNPNHISAYELLAEIAAQNKLYSEATSYLSRIDVQGDTHRKNLIARQIAQLQLSSGRGDEAIRILRDIVTTEKDVDSQIQIADIYRSQENYKDALKEYNRAYDMIDSTITARYWDLSFARGMTHERLKNWEQAEKDLQTALLFQPDQPYVLNYLGYSWADQGINLDKATEMIEKAVRIKPDDGAIIDSLGWVYFRMGKFDKAVATLEKAIELQPNEPEINDHLGDAYWRVGRLSEARFQWKRAMSFTKNNDLMVTLQTKLDKGLPPLSATTEDPSKIVNNTKK